MPGEQTANYKLIQLRHGCRVATAEEAIERSVRSGGRVFVATACGKPRALIDALVAQSERLRDVEIVHAHGVMELVLAGVITGARKTIHRGKVVAGFLMGSYTLYEWVDDNPMAVVCQP